ncbi:hypothetical protein [Thalassobaculum sp.]|uniref:hypothetical protein n=1 Tax=Thalassobaculum sp. TaxID=2022740 RepID=UPI0032ECF17A
MTGSQAEVGGSAAQRVGASSAWFPVLRRYLAVIAVGNLAWEFVQLPLYTIWHDGTPREIAFAALHCTGGDVLIAGAALLGALLVAGTGEWPRDRFATVAVLAMLGGLGYTVFSEWLNTEIRASWAYTETMPRLPLIGTGLAPLAQWIVVPLFAFWWARRRVARGG